MLTAAEDARKALSEGESNWIKWVALSVGAAALLLASGGLALAAAPGLAGAAAITSALAAFGPGGMIGGLLTAGALVSAGGGGVAVGLASPTTTAEAVEAIVSTQLAAAILRKAQGLEQDPTTWHNLIETGIALRRDRTRLEPFSDESAQTLKELKKKLATIDRALAYLNEEDLRPSDTDSAYAAKSRGTEFLDRAADAFRAVDLDGDGIPDKPRARAAVDDAGSAIKEAAAEAADAVSSFFRRRRDAKASADEIAPEPTDEDD